MSARDPIEHPGGFPPFSPVRDVVRRSHGGYVSLFFSTKSDVPIECESLLELDTVRILEVDPTVTRIVHQPCELFWTLDGVKKRHVPDFGIHQRGRRAIIEVKHSSAFRDRELGLRTRKVKKKLRERGIAYQVLTERFVRAQPRLDNARLVLRGMGHAPLPAERGDILDVLRANRGPMTIGDIVTALYAPPSFANSILALVLSRELFLVDGAAAPGGRNGAMTTMVRLRDDLR